MKYCQGPNCHTYDTQDRKRGPKGNKKNQTRRRSNLYYGNGNFCDQRCMYDWFNKFGNQAVNHFGRLTQPKRLEADNAWNKFFDWDRGCETKTYYTYNQITRERRLITKNQYDDNNYTLNV